MTDSKAGFFEKTDISFKKSFKQSRLQIFVSQKIPKKFTFSFFIRFPLAFKLAFSEYFKCDIFQKKPASHCFLLPGSAESPPPESPPIVSCPRYFIYKFIFYFCLFTDCAVTVKYLFLYSFHTVPICLATQVQMSRRHNVWPGG